MRYWKLRLKVSSNKMILKFIRWKWRWRWTWCRDPVLWRHLYFECRWGAMTSFGRKVAVPVSQLLLWLCGLGGKESHRWYAILSSDTLHLTDKADTKLNVAHHSISEWLWRRSLSASGRGIIILWVEMLFPGRFCQSIPPHKGGWSCFPCKQLTTCCLWSWGCFFMKSCLRLWKLNILVPGRDIAWVVGGEAWSPFVTLIMCYSVISYCF